MKNTHILFIWEEISMRKKIWKKIPKIYDFSFFFFFCKFGINKFSSVSHWNIILINKFHIMPLKEVMWINILEYSLSRTSLFLHFSNYFSGPLKISTKYTLIFSFYLKPLYLELLSISNKNFAIVATILSISRSL